MMRNTVRFKVSKRAVHLNAGWRWLINDTEGDGFIDGEEYESLSDAEHRAMQLNGAEDDAPVSRFGVAQ